MASVSQTAHNVEITAESLQEDLSRLEVQKQALERELAAVVAHLSSVQRALGAFEVLMLNSNSAGSVRANQAEPAVVAQATSSSPDAAVPAPTPKPVSKSQTPTTSERQERLASTAASTDGNKYGKLTEQIMAYFAQVGDADVRARDVAAALGRDGDSGSINGVRSTLDRLVGASRVERAGRGLYRAKRP